MPSELEAAARDGAAAGQPTFAEAFAVWTRIGFLSFGGPAGQIALMHRVLVDERKWIDERYFLQALNFCMLLPGPEAMQLATYVGWRLHGVRGGLAAGLMFVIPGALLMLLLSALYATFGKLPVAAALLVGVKAAVLAIVVEALIRIARRGLKEPAHPWLAGLAFVAIFFFAVPFPVIVLAAALYGLLTGSGARDVAIDATLRREARSEMLAATLRTTAIWLAIWLLPLIVLATMLGSSHVLTQIGWFFSKLAVVSFGGAYAVLAYMAQDAVQYYHWLDAGRDGRRARPRRDDAGPADPRHRVRRLSRRASPWRRVAPADGNARRCRHAMGDVRAMLPVDLRRRALPRAHQRRAALAGGPRRRHRRRRRRHPQSDGVVRAARPVCAIRGGLDRPAATSSAGAGER